MQSYTKMHIRLCTTTETAFVTRSTEMRNKSGHVKSGKSTSKSIGDGFALKFMLILMSSRILILKLSNFISIHLF